MAHLVTTYDLLILRNSTDNDFFFKKRDPRKSEELGGVTLHAYSGCAHVCIRLLMHAVTSEEDVTRYVYV